MGGRRRKPLRRQPFRQLTPGERHFVARRMHRPSRLAAPGLGMPARSKVATCAARSARLAACHIISIPFRACSLRTSQTVVHAHHGDNPFSARNCAAAPERPIPRARSPSARTAGARPLPSTVANVPARDHPGRDTRAHLQAARRLVDRAARRPGGGPVGADGRAAPPDHAEPADPGRPQASSRRISAGASASAPICSAASSSR
jgi:hypothetical protein